MLLLSDNWQDQWVSECCEKIIAELHGRFPHELVDFCCLDPRYFGTLDGEQQLRHLVSRYQLDPDRDCCKSVATEPWVCHCRRWRHRLAGSLQASTTDLQSAEADIQSAQPIPVSYVLCRFPDDIQHLLDAGDRVGERSPSPQENPESNVRWYGTIHIVSVDLL